MRKRAIIGGILSLVLLVVLAACYLPNNFKSEIRLGRTGDFALSYYGELVWAPLFRDIQQNKVPAADIPGKIALIRKDLQRDSGFTSVESMGAGRFEVSYEHEGHLRPSDMFSFVRRNAVIIEIVASPDGLVRIDGNTLKPSDAQTATTMGLSVRGEFRIITDGMVKEHNATTVKTLGPYTIYIWTIENAFSPSPHFAMMRDGAWTNKEHTAK
jgi:hypothetical protein